MNKGIKWGRDTLSSNINDLTPDEVNILLRQQTLPVTKFRAYLTFMN